MDDQQPQPADILKHMPNQPDYYFEAGLLVYTATYHLKRGSCCGSGFRHLTCPP